MSRSLGSTLPADLLALLSQGDLPGHLGRGVPLITVDADGRPHPMLCSYLEILAVDARTIRVAIGAQSRSARNLEERRAATLLIVEPERTVYIKARAAGPAVRVGPLARFGLGIEDVLEDMPADWEAGVAITSGITYAPAPDLDAGWVRETLAALRG